MVGICIDLDIPLKFEGLLLVCCLVVGFDVGKIWFGFVFDFRG